MKKGLITRLHCNFNREAICTEKSSLVCSIVIGENVFTKCSGNDWWQTYTFELTYLGIEQFYLRIEILILSYTFTLSVY